LTPNLCLDGQQSPQSSTEFILPVVDKNNIQEAQMYPLF
jgi:hypothetical protein